jgi:hypothetical protein
VKFRKAPAQLWQGLGTFLALGPHVSFGGGEAAFGLCDDETWLSSDPPIKQTIELQLLFLLFFFHANNMAGEGVSHEEIWDDSALLNSWDDALAEYKVGITTPILWQFETINWPIRRNTTAWLPRAKPSTWVNWKKLSRQIQQIQSPTSNNKNSNNLQTKRSTPQSSIRKLLLARAQRHNL